MAYCAVGLIVRIYGYPIQSREVIIPDIIYLSGKKTNTLQTFM